MAIRVRPDRTPAARALPRAAPGAWILAAVLLAAAVLRFATLSTQSLWEDEGFTAQIGSSSLHSAASQIPKTESTPPLYYALEWGWVHLFGSSEATLRSLSALFGCLTVVAVYWAAVGLASQRVALIAAALTAVSPIMVWYSQEARAYALFVLLCTLAFGFFTRALEDRRRVWLLGWSVCSAAALATHYFGVFPLVVEAVWLLFKRRGPSTVVAMTLPAAVGGALIPLLLYQKAHVPRPWTSIYTVYDQARAIGQSFFVGITWTPLIHRYAVALLAILALAAAHAAIRLTGERRQRVAVALVAFVAITLALPTVVSLLGTNYLAPRNVLYAWPLLALLAALGIGRPGAGRVSAAGLVLGLAVSLAIVVAVATTPRLQREDWRGLLHELGPAPGPRAVAVVNGFTIVPVVRYYVRGLRTPRHPFSVHRADVILFDQPLRNPARFAPARGLALQSERVNGHIVLLQFAAASPVSIPPSAPKQTIFEQSGS